MFIVVGFVSIQTDVIAPAEGLGLSSPSRNLLPALRIEPKISFEASKHV